MSHSANIVKMKKTNYFYIDEAGSFGNSSNVFIHGCIKTDTSEILENALLGLKDEIIDELYYEAFVERVKLEGFHAADNHPDIKSEFYKLLPRLDYRAYFVILNKETDYYKNLSQEKEEWEIFEYSLRKLLKDRIVKNRTDKNIFYFERIDIKKKPLSSILKEFFSEYNSSYDCEYHIVGKEVNNLAVIDYLNYIFEQISKTLNKKRGNKESEFDRMKLKFNLVKSKIGVINLLHNDLFLSRKGKKEYFIEYENLIKNLVGS